ncbi:MAG: glycosyltransferase family 2 protein [Omnitrophica WOR_2 bacterium]
MPPLPFSVVIVTHNHAEYLDCCLASLIPETNQQGGEIIVIDNLSSDNSVGIIQKYPQVKLHINQKPRGFAANYNLGMAYAQGKYLLLLNPDTEVNAGALKILFEFMENNQKVGICGSQLTFPDGTIQHSARRFPNLGTVIVRRTPLRIFLKNSKTNQQHLMVDMDYAKPQNVDWLLGACLMVRREAIEQVGPLDEGYFLYVEDIDWAKRMHHSGWDVYYVPEAKIIHHHLAVSDKRFFSRRMWIHIQSMIRYARKHIIRSVPVLSIQGDRTEIWQHTRANLLEYNSKSGL